MIQDEDLEDEGFIFYTETLDWRKDNISLFVEDGIITFIRERDNYHGLSVWINTIYKLRVFLELLK